MQTVGFMGNLRPKTMDKQDIRNVLRWQAEGARKARSAWSIAPARVCALTNARSAVTPLSVDAIACNCSKPRRVSPFVNWVRASAGRSWASSGRIFNEAEEQAGRDAVVDHVEHRAGARPDHPAGAGIAIDLGQNVADHISDREEEDPGPERPGADARQLDGRDLAGPEHVRKQQDGDEGRHHEVEIAKASPRQRPGVDRALFRPLHDPRPLALFRWKGKQASLADGRP